MISYQGAVSRQHLLFPERIAPLVLLNLCHCIFYFLAAILYLSSWECSSSNINTTKLAKSKKKKLKVK